MLVKELKTKKPQELKKLIDDLKAELFMLRFKNSTGQLENSHKIDLVKKDIARVFTVLNEFEETKKEKPKTIAKKTSVKNKKSVVKKEEVSK